MDGSLNENAPIASSSDFVVRAHRLTFAARSEISAPEWFTTTKCTCGFCLESSTRRIPVTSTNFWRVLGLAKPAAGGFSSFNGALGALADAWLSDELKCRT